MKYQFTGDDLWRLRKWMRLTQAQMADLVGISKNHYWTLENSITETVDHKYVGIWLKQAGLIKHSWWQPFLELKESIGERPIRARKKDNTL
ncbi:helix-turn-helix domain-containing protein [Pseudoalteromonas sp. McH1-7]|nr:MULTISPECIES: helix-turn-helix transcriptional regulator [Pseudoalteromonas]MDW7551283.1 helix-turn-helix transcriptional regulator [Pseudoalteromonas peptidolytica]NLR15244.1 helix-turn-helix domain-containing protein [Pseudoalteromonas peptidolytica]NUZ11898.1 helix-turn-helix domain-containing protein [Pseudoalteromonas sp. McH1-7]